MTFRRRTRRGFTLIEVLAALLLLGIVLPAAMGGLNLCMRAAAHARHKQEAALLAESKLNEILAARDAAAFGSGGAFGDDWPEYRWSLATAAGPFGLDELDLTVDWQERGRTQSLTLGTMMLPGLAPDAAATGGAFGG